ncbi:hypothetical protein BN8_03676 [Fibrisoma limi BUZ 3]|uniref:Ammonia monooxygenase n=1 Tax=Fibrisoma limi BUZ 3 TaxID=1185876 RepID=I2GKS4_9BACT|nr:DUF6527 family protein [Fibrisoma limi]CCH54500.1 hypothetical protein BN8_03676 [Fibrisoma limi BUZ 3]
MAKLMEIINGKTFSHIFFCPGCQCGHGVNVKPDNQAPVWTLVGTLDNPTVQPSIRVQSGNEHGPTVCHSFITDGKIQFLSDCTHALAGQTVELPDMDD